uniref:N-acetylglucosaminyltransferase fringe n=1 Tax=Platynereis dumerilii TaxID=6359 RepID=A0A1C6ZZW3_PLADU|nr:N-acetylglucosaminyltransferase fringe [Platynereis dumerilii]
MRIPVKKGVQAFLLACCVLGVNVLYVFLQQEIKQHSSAAEFFQQDGGKQSQEDVPKLGRSLFERSRRSMLNESYNLKENVTDQGEGVNGKNKAFLSHKADSKSSKTVSQVFQDPSKKSSAFHHTNNNNNNNKILKNNAQFTNGYNHNNAVYKNEVKLSEVFVSVKTTGKFHASRIPILLETWVVMGRDAVHFFTDVEDEELKSKILPGRLINTNCSARHTRAALCCKMSLEFDMFLASKRKWFCHVDDDTYLNIPALLRLLKQYNSTGDWYLGKPSLNHPLEIKDIEYPKQKTAFWFATGAGFCVSRGLALKMMPYAGGGRLRSVCEKVRLPDDCSIGFIIYYYMKKELTVVPGFHSHLEGLWLIKPRDLENHITFSYGQSGHATNVVRVGGFSQGSDPTRFRSIHCHLYPNLPQCANIEKDFR